MLVHMWSKYSKKLFRREHEKEKLPSQRSMVEKTDFGAFNILIPNSKVNFTQWNSAVDIQTMFQINTFKVLTAETTTKCKNSDSLLKSVIT